MTRQHESIIELSKQIGGFNAGPQLQDDIQSNVKSLLTLSQKVKNNITQLRESNAPDLDSVENAFNQLSRRIQSELPDVIKSLRNVSSGPGPSSGGGGGGFNPTVLQQSLVDDQSDQLDMLEQEVQSILSTMREVNTLFHQTLEEIQKQRHMLVTIEASTEKAKDDMESGILHLDKAGENQKSSNRALCWILIILVVVVVGVVLFCILFFTRKKKPEGQ